jgi:putative CocE/NonD family hydrolase
MLSLAAPETTSMHTHDGVRLDATVWRPAGSGRYPVLLMRQPYGRAIASTLVYAHPAWYAAHGYIVAVQDVRGTGSSAGEFRLFLDEEVDGAQAVAWAANLPGSSGAVGMYGFSYQANTQYLALAGGGALRALAPAMGGWDMRGDWAWEGGAFRLAPNLGWGLQMGVLKAAHDGAPEAAQAMRKAAQALPLADWHRTQPDIIRAHGAWTHYEAWLTHPEPGAFWDAFAPRARLSTHKLNVPMLHIGGWYDQMLMGTLDAQAAIASRSEAEQALYVGPWTHQPWGRRVGAVDFGPDAISPIDAVQLAWFDRHLKDQEAARPSGVSLFDLGLRSWHHFSKWPQATSHPWFLSSDGLAAARSSGTLSLSPAAPACDYIVHDPWRPAPVCGGHGSAPAGMQDRAALDDRADIAVYTSAPMERPLFLCGRVTVTLHLEADQPSFDIDAVFSMVEPNGRAWNVSQGHARLDAPGACDVSMRAVCVTVPAGHALRLSLAAAASPSYAVNPGTGAQAADFIAAEERIITIAIRAGDPASCLVLPVVE